MTHFSRILICLNLFLLLCSGAMPLAAQGWLQILPDQGTPTKVVSRPGQGCYMAITLNPQSNTDRRALLCHYNEAGQLVWRSEYLNLGEVSDLVLTDDNGITTIGYDLSAGQNVLHHFNAQGTVQWSKNLSPLYLKSRITAFPGGGYMVESQYRENGFTPPTKIGLQRLAADGTSVWRSPIDTISSGQLLQSYGLATNAAGQSIWAYRYGGTTTPKYFIGTFETTGDTLWRTSDAKIQNAGVLADGNFVRLSYSANGYSIQKISPYGAILWNKPYSEFFAITLDVMLPRPDGGFSICGTGIGLNGKTIRIVSFDAQGNLAFNIERPLPGFESNSLNVTAIASAPDGGYYLNGIVWDANNTASRVFLVRLNADGSIFNQYVLGSVRNDLNLNCLPDPTDAPMAGQLLSLEKIGTGDVFYATTDSSGHYSAEVVAAEYRVSPMPLNPYWHNCLGDTLANFPAGSDSLLLDFPLQKVVDCPFLEVDISTLRLRRCFDSRYYVRYCNTGTATAYDAYVDVTLDPALTFLSASRPGLLMGGQLWRFPVDSVPVGTCGNFYIDVHVDCDSTVLGQTHCTTAHIYPDSFCLQNGAWSGAEVDVKAKCQPDSVRLTIHNIGTGPNAGPLGYIVIEDNIIFRQGNFQLGAGDSLVLRVPANGSTWRIEADQEPFAPANPMPSATVEGCGANAQGAFSIGFVSQFGESDGDPFVSIDCRENVGAFDPNDKQGFPKGVDNEHFIEPNQPIEYLIRFQNTGTDTAFTVVVRDTLDPWLDPATLRSGASSHDYRFQMSGKGILSWTFNRILLPDSSTNLIGSQGFVKFQVSPRVDAPLGARLHNRAGIYFDFNAPVLTNTTLHTLGRNFLNTHQPDPAAAPALLQFSPNPAQDETTVRYTGNAVSQGMLQVFDVRGRLCLEQTWNGQQQSLRVQTLPSGLYLVKLMDRGVAAAWGKLVKFNN